MKQEEKKRYLYWEMLAAGIAALLYFLLALHGIGNDRIPETGWIREERGGEIRLDLGGEQEVYGLIWFLGNYENRRFTVSRRQQGQDNWENVAILNMNPVYQWGEARLEQPVTAEYLLLQSENQFADIRELAVVGAGGEILPVANQEAYPELFDEFYCYQEPAGYQTGAVFDEIVFARTGYEYLHQLRSYEDTHPPLGKLLLSAGIAWFGMHPFGWRILEVLAGTLMLPVVYVIVRRLTGSCLAAAAGMLLMAFDCLHFTQTRIGTVDGFLTLFILISYGWMYDYISAARNKKTQYRQWLSLAGSGIFMGLAVACKWSGIYAGAGLAVLLLMALIEGYRKKWIEPAQIAATGAVCALVFVIIPLLIYSLSYLPYIGLDPETGFWQGLLRNQQNMFLYHTNYQYKHPSALSWYQWFGAVNPHIYSYRELGGQVEIVAAFGNPVVWWSGLAAAGICLWRWWGKQDKTAGILLISYLAQILPWLPVQRSTFIYHYFPGLMFSVLMLSYWLSIKKKKTAAVLLVLMAAGFFIRFYPVLAGQLVEKTYVAERLEPFLGRQLLPEDNRAQNTGE